MRGLTKEICSAINLYKPRTVDAAISFSQLQEVQLAEESKKPSYKNAGKGLVGEHHVEAAVTCFHRLYWQRLPLLRV